MAVKQKHHDEYLQLSARRRALVLLLAVATAMTVVWMLLARPGDPKRDALRAARERAAAAASAAAASGVGGKADVILLPSAPSTPR